MKLLPIYLGTENLMFWQFFHDLQNCILDFLNETVSFWTCVHCTATGEGKFLWYFSFFFMIQSSLKETELDLGQYKND